MTDGRHDKEAEFANILFAGPCNLACPRCIGRLLGTRPSNLRRWPLLGIERFVDELRRREIRQLSITGTDTDPLLYRHDLHHRLLDLLRARLPEARLSLHTNGLLALERRDVVTRYDRAAISFCSFDPATTERMTGRRWVIDLERLIGALPLPVKLSVLVTEDNADQVRGLIARVARQGVRRLALRRPVTAAGERDEPPLARRLPWLADLSPTGRFGGNPVYAIDGVEVTAWDFDRAALRCLNLFSDGTITDGYALSASRGQRSQTGADRGA